MTNENLLPNYYKELNEAIKVAGQIRRSSLLVNDEDNNWRVLVINDRLKLHKDLLDLNLPEAEGFAYINDNFSNILRTKAQLNVENIRFLADIIKSYNGTNNLLNQRLPDISQRIKKLVTIAQKEVKSVSEERVETATRSGSYDLNNKEFIVYYKKFYSESLKIEQQISETEVEDFSLYISLKNKNSIGVAEPILRKNHVPIDEVYSHIAQNQSIQLQLKLKNNIFQRIKDTMFSLKNPDDLFNIRSPLGKPVLGDLTNYNIIELQLL